MSKFQIGHRVLIQAVVRDVPHQGPLVLQLGTGATPGMNISVHESHLHPDTLSGPVPRGTGERDMNIQSVRNTPPPVYVPTSDPAEITKQLKEQESLSSQDEIALKQKVIENLLLDLEKAKDANDSASAEIDRLTDLLTASTPTGPAPATMRAKFVISEVLPTNHSHEGKANDGEKWDQVTIKANAVTDKPFDPDGISEDNSFARWTPTGTLEMVITNPDLFDKIKESDKFYLDFTKVDVDPEPTPNA